MNALKISTIVLALGFAAGMGCGSDSGTTKTDAPVITPGTGGTVSTGGVLGTGGIAGAGGIVGAGGIMGTGGSIPVDAPIATGGSGGSLDAGGQGGAAGMDGGAPDLPITPVDVGGGGEAGTEGEAAPPTNICTGLSAAACDEAIRNASVESTVVAQDVPVISATTYPACAQ
jgi:hypothetical protein